MTTIADRARNTLKRLLELNLPPTPENYHRVFDSLGGTRAAEGPVADSQASTPADWGGAIRRLIGEWDRSQSGLSQLEKRRQIDRLGAIASAQSLWPELDRLLERWAALPARNGHAVAGGGGTGDPAAGEASALWRELWLHTLKHGVRPFCQDEACRRLLRELMDAAERGGQTPQDLQAAARDLWLVLDRAGADGAAIENALIDLLRLVLGNLGELVPQPWVAAQATAIRERLNPPLDLERIEQSQRDIRDLLLRHSVMRKGQDEAHTTAKTLIDLLVRHLAEYTAAGTAYNERLDNRLEQLQASDEWDEIRQLVTEVLEDSRAMQRRSGELGAHLADAQRQAHSAQERIRVLEGELEQASQQLLEDPLTGALNRRGLDVEFGRAVLDAQHGGRPLTLVLLDLDHFKEVNDLHGHDAGDAALRALVQLAKRLIRPSDHVARMGGEEFMLLLPGAGEQQSEPVVRRLLSAFSEQALVHDASGRGIALSFSAGIGQFCQGEDFAAVYQRVDMALLRAKQAGRKRIEFAAPCADPVKGGGAPAAARRRFVIGG